jgi:hypothetical protein
MARACAGRITEEGWLSTQAYTHGGWTGTHLASSTRSHLLPQHAAAMFM